MQRYEMILNYPKILSKMIRKNRPDSLINQRLPGINDAKIEIIPEYSK